MTDGVCSWQAQGPIPMLVETPEVQEMRISNFILIAFVRCVRPSFLLEQLQWFAQVFDTDPLLGTKLYAHFEPYFELLYPSLHLRSGTFFEGAFWEQCRHACRHGPVGFEAWLMFT